MQALEDLLFDEMYVIYLGVGGFGWRVKHSQLTLNAAQSRFSVPAHMLPLRHSSLPARKEETILLAPFLIAPVTIIHLRKKKKTLSSLE